MEYAVRLLLSDEAQPETFKVCLNYKKKCTLLTVQVFSQFLLFVHNYLMLCICQICNNYF